MYKQWSYPMEPESQDYSPSTPAQPIASAKTRMELCSSAPDGESPLLSGIDSQQAILDGRGSLPIDLDSWRTMEPSVFDGERCLQFRAALLEIQASTDITRDPAVCVGAALDLMFGVGLTAPETNLVMSAILLHTLQGDFTAHLVLIQALRRLARSTTGDHRSSELATRWAKWNPAEAPLRLNQLSHP